MKITWHDFAKQDLVEIFHYIIHENLAAAYKILDEINDQIAILETFPQAGRHGRVNNTRELIIVRTPFIAVYQISNDALIILRILHGSRKWPPI